MSVSSCRYCSIKMGAVDRFFSIARRFREVGRKVEGWFVEGAIEPSSFSDVVSLMCTLSDARLPSPSSTQLTSHHPHVINILSWRVRERACPGVTFIPIDRRIVVPRPFNADDVPWLSQLYNVISKGPLLSPEAPVGEVVSGGVVPQGLHLTLCEVVSLPWGGETSLYARILLHRPYRVAGEVLLHFFSHSCFAPRPPPSRFIALPDSLVTFPLSGRNDLFFFLPLFFEFFLSSPCPVAIWEHYSILDKYALDALLPGQHPYDPYLNGFSVSVDALEVGLRLSPIP
ncbi:hypothetical protein GW17_00007440 [Ensete ventricosum]|nr:hypothetical protein GW17_00007440 [Ensete ventricosum]RZS00582.1 hypothetical protein BHM03_00030332 [Ensete ventricosum]